MIPLDYLVLRLARRHLPGRIIREMLARRIILTPGLETTDPAAAVQRFLDAIAASGTTVVGRRVLIFGYGGSYGVGVGLLGAGAKHVVLVDPYAVAVPAANRALTERSRFLALVDGQARPLPEFMTVVSAPLGSYLAAGGEPADIVLSNSVLEHVSDVAETVPELARAMARGRYPDPRRRPAGSLLQAPVRDAVPLRAGLARVPESRQQPQPPAAPGTTSGSSGRASPVSRSSRWRPTSLPSGRCGPASGPSSSPATTGATRSLLDSGAARRTTELSWVRRRKATDPRRAARLERPGSRGAGAARYGRATRSTASAWQVSPRRTRAGPIVESRTR